MIAFVVGTRPELIKTSPVIHELRARGAPFCIIHTGQHYTRELDDIFFAELDLPAPEVNLEVGSRPPTAQVAAIIDGVGTALARLRPRFVLVQGDTNSVLGGAIAAHKLEIPLAHLEAGLRSDDWGMPEEGNRVVAGRVAAVHLCPTKLQADRLAREGLTRGVYVVGNTVVDATLRYSEVARTKSAVAARLDLAPGRFAVLTMHRPSNVDDPVRLRRWLEALDAAGEHLRVPVVFPVHPRTRAAMQKAGLEPWRGPALRLCEPLGYLDTLWLVGNARIALTDSGGIQEEACTLRVPCVTLRANTERPETLDVGANVLCPSDDVAALIGAVDRMLAVPRTWANPLGDGQTARRVADLLLDPGTPRRPSGEPVPAV